jgi:carbon storage regulator CsrA
MLVLTRKLNQEIHIGETIHLQVLRIQGSRVTIGISCPRELRVLRGEIQSSHSYGSEALGDHCHDLRHG